MNNLVNKIKEASTVYYGTGETIMSDDEFDALTDRLRALDTEHELLVTNDWGATPVANDRVLVPHRKELYTIDTKIKDFETAKLMIGESDEVQPKVDGIAGLAYFTDGKLESVVTRNNGLEGFDIKNNINIDGIKHLMKYNGQARVEIAMRISDFEKHYDIEKNPSPRNLISGICSKLKVTELERSLAIPVILDVDGEINELNKDSVIAPLIELEEHLPVWEFGTDGYVIKKYNENNVVCDIFAYKPQGEKKTTTVLDIVWQLGNNTGKLTPVLVVEPVLISGALISRVTGNSVQMMEELNCGIGSKIGIIRSGLVIPKLIEVYKGSDNFNLPKYDYRKGAHLFMDVKINLYTRVLEMMMLQKHFGRALVDKIMEFEPIDSFGSLTSLLTDGVNPDYFTNHEQELINKAIEMLKKLTMPEFVIGLNLPNIGKSAITKIINGQKLPSHSDKTWNEYYRPVYDLIEDLKLLGFNLTTEVDNKTEIDSKGNVAITGKFEQKRKDMTLAIEKLGYKVVDKINKDTDILIIADTNSTSSKAKSARKLGIKLISNIEELV